MKRAEAILIGILIAALTGLSYGASVTEGSNVSATNYGEAKLDSDYQLKQKQGRRTTTVYPAGTTSAARGGDTVSISSTDICTNAAGGCPILDTDGRISTTQMQPLPVVVPAGWVCAGRTSSGTSTATATSTGTLWVTNTQPVSCSDTRTATSTMSNATLSTTPPLALSSTGTITETVTNTNTATSTTTTATTATATGTASASQTASTTATFSYVVAEGDTVTRTNTHSFTATGTVTGTRTTTLTATKTVADAVDGTSTQTLTVTGTGTATGTGTGTATLSTTAIGTLLGLKTNTYTASITGATTYTRTATSTGLKTATETVRAAGYIPLTATGTVTFTTVSATNTASATLTNTNTSTGTTTSTSTVTGTTTGSSTNAATARIGDSPTIGATVAEYTLPIAGTSTVTGTNTATLGGVKVGPGITRADDGTISASAGMSCGDTCSNGSWATFISAGAALTNAPFTPANASTVVTKNDYTISTPSLITGATDGQITASRALAAVDISTALGFTVQPSPLATSAIGPASDVTTSGSTGWFDVVTINLSSVSYNRAAVVSGGVTISLTIASILCNARLLLDTATVIGTPVQVGNSTLTGVKQVAAVFGAVVIASGAAHTLKLQISSNSTSACIAMQNKANLVAALLY